MDRLIRAEFGRLRNPFYRKFLLAYMGFYLLYPIFFWFFGRYHAEVALRTYSGIDFLCSMPHYLEYFWIWLPILCGRYISDELKYGSYVSLLFSGCSRKTIFISKLLIYYLLCIPLLAIRTITFPAVWSVLGRRGFGFDKYDLSVFYIRYFGNYVTEHQVPAGAMLGKAIMYSIVSFYLLATVVFIISFYSESKSLTVLLCFLIIVVPREGIGMAIHPTEDSPRLFHRVLYRFITEDIYSLDWKWAYLLCSIGIVIVLLLIMVSLCIVRHMDFNAGN